MQALQSIPKAPCNVQVMYRHFALLVSRSGLAKTAKSQCVQTASLSGQGVWASMGVACDFPV